MSSNSIEASGVLHSFDPSASAGALAPSSAGTEDPESPAPKPPVGSRTKGAEEISMLAVFTLVIWLACVIVGVLSKVITPAPKAPAPPKPPAVMETIQAELVETTVSAAEIPPAAPTQIQPDNAPIPIDSGPAVPAAPAVAAPSPAIAFAVPVEGAVRVVSSQFAGRPTLAEPVRLIPHIIRAEDHIELPKPLYPEAARVLGQEGTVPVMIAVDEAGNVTSVALAPGSRFPLLNQAVVDALKAYHFRPGERRLWKTAFIMKLND